MPWRGGTARVTTVTNQALAMWLLIQGSRRRRFVVGQKGALEATLQEGSHCTNIRWLRITPLTVAGCVGTIGPTHAATVAGCIDRRVVNGRGLTRIGALPSILSEGMCRNKPGITAGVRR